MSEQSQFLLYTAPDGAVKVGVILKDETVWLTQKTLAELFGVRLSRSTWATYSAPENWPRIQYVPFWNILLELSDYPILQDKGKVSALEAKLKAEGEYEVYRQRQDTEYLSDFDRAIKRLEGNKE